MKWFVVVVCMFVGRSEAFGNIGSMISSINPLNMLFTNRCIEDLGCFYTGPPFFNPMVRPISLPPANNMKPKFMLYTKDNPSNAYLLEPTQRSLQNSKFDPNAKTMWYMHGFRFKLTLKDTEFQIKDELMKQGGYNVIIVDWSDYNGMPYDQAVANTRVVGAMIAKMNNFLIKQKGISPQSIHLVGHSLGAHIAGYAGERIPNLYRITGLDPAGPGFRGTPPAVRLDTGDANFVDIIHTNAADSILSGLGMTEAIGHLDFYPNGGSKQPGCANATGDEAPPSDPTAIFGKFKCDHMRAIRYFLASINCRFQSVQCKSYADYQKGKCGGNSIVSPMGFQAQKKTGLGAQNKFYLKTSAAPPYCLQ